MYACIMYSLLQKYLSYTLPHHALDTLRIPITNVSEMTSLDDCIKHVYVRAFGSNYNQ